MEKYSFLTVAPCSFSLEGQVFTLSAGQTFSVSPSIGEKIISPSFNYRKFITLIHKPTPSVVSPEPTPKTVKAEPTPKTVKAEPAPKTVKAEPVPKAVAPEPVSKVVEPEPTPKVVEPEPAPKVAESKEKATTETEGKKSRYTKKQS